MAASNSEGKAPFLTYLTVFKSRLGVANIVLSMTGFGYTPAAALARKLKGKLSEVVPIRIHDPAGRPVLDYLVEKKLIGPGLRAKGRYKNVRLERDGDSWRALDEGGTVLPELEVFQTDVWLADPSVQSTIGVPTPENAEEALELCFQLHLLSSSKCAWTAAGQLAEGLRKRSPSPKNPMVLGLEVTALIRQVIERDGLLLRELIRRLGSPDSRIARDDIAVQLAEIAGAAQSAAMQARLPPLLLANGKKFVALLKETGEKRQSASSGPGVLEHRTSPRLEWLTDFGVLTKQGIPKNSFEYFVTRDAGLLLSLTDSDPTQAYWADDAALGYWRASFYLQSLRQTLAARFETREALREGYRLMKRSVGPAPIREVCFAAGVLAPNLSLSMGQFADELLAWATGERAITLSGGRYSRKPELVHFGPEIGG